MRARSIHFYTALAAAIFLVVGTAAHAVTLDWDTAQWTPGTLTQSFDIDGVPGNDITITISGNTNKLTTDPGTGFQSPDISSTLEGGMGGRKSLFLGGDLSTQTDFIVTVTFTGAFASATNVSFKIFDIDLGTDHEKIVSISALQNDGTQIAPTITGVGSAVGLTGTGLAQVLTGNAAANDTGANSSDGNATISYGSTAIHSFTFDFKNDSGPPRPQSIGLFNIDFTPVPEMNPACAAAAVLAIAGGFTVARRHRRFSPGPC